MDPYLKIEVPFLANLFRGNASNKSKRTNTLGTEGSWFSLGKMRKFMKIYNFYFTLLV